MASNKEIGEQYGIHPRDVEKIKFAFEVYDFKGDGKVDGFYIGDLVRACNLNPTMKTIVEIGGEKEKGKKTIVLEDNGVDIDYFEISAYPVRWQDSTLSWTRIRQAPFRRFEVPHPGDVRFLVTELYP